MKIMAIILFGSMGLAFVLDLIVINEVHSQAGRAIEHSIDAGIVYSGKVEDAKQGIVRLDEWALREATRSEFQKNMGLDNHLENKIIKNGQFRLKLDYIEETPLILVEFGGDVSFSLPFLDYPITVQRRVPYESIYK
ncbi:MULTISPECIES: hypothetical protein [Paenibacillus]|uniref:hypothetical protein n=1 Tax=Paenibacillus TaxID=44249 RepID=UPI001BD02F21|nr:hypothetical protein [Paenibacillus dendritiformis]